MILAVDYGREKKIPYLGICFGMKSQLLNLRDMYYVLKMLILQSLILTLIIRLFDIMDDQKHINDKGGIVVDSEHTHVD